MPKSSKSEIKARGNLAVPDNGVYFLTDPCHMDDGESDWLGVYVFTEWHRHGLNNAPIYAIVEQDEYGHERNRAVVVTDGSPAPSLLLAKQARGAFVFHDRVGVDAGMIGIFTNYAQDRPQFDSGMDAPNAVTMDGEAAIFNTFFGDGQYPIALWGQNGKLTAFAVLTDRRYFDLD